MKNKINHIAWNTKCPYTSRGQRIVCFDTEQGVYMIDVDRNIEYLLPDCEMNKWSVMRRYNYNINCERFNVNSDDDLALCNKLHKLAVEIAEDVY